LPFKCDLQRYNEENAQLYALPDDIKARAAGQYQRDVERVHGAVGRCELNSVGP
jgi:hypothetical protein